MATENALMAAALTPGSTVIHNAASEPHVQDLARLLLQMGARIEGIGSNVLIVHGESTLGGADYAIGPDYIEIGQLHRAGRVHRRRAADQGRGGRRPADDPARVRAAGLPDRVRRRRRGRAAAASALRVKDDEGDAISKIEDGPWPAFPADLTSIALALATQADGMVLIHEKMFENRLFFVDKLVSMGARVIALRSAPRGRQRPEPASRRAHGEPGHPGRHGDAHRRAVRRGPLGDRQHPPDRPRLRAHRRAAARRWARASSACRRGCAARPV